MQEEIRLFFGTGNPELSEKFSESVVSGVGISSRYSPETYYSERQHAR
jgi:hypothetical protein